MGMIVAGVPLVTYAAGFVVMTPVMSKERIGYREYAGWVRYRLLPGVW